MIYEKKISKKNCRKKIVEKKLSKKNCRKTIVRWKLQKPKLTTKLYTINKMCTTMIYGTKGACIRIWIWLNNFKKPKLTTKLYTINKTFRQFFFDNFFSTIFFRHFFFDIFFSYKTLYNKQNLYYNDLWDQRRVYKDMDMTK